MVVTGVVAAVVSFFVGYGDAKEFQDHMLKQIALLASQGTVISAPQETARPKPGRHASVESANRIKVIRLPEDPRPVWLTENLKAGFRTVETDNVRLRVFVLGDVSGQATVVAQPTDTRDEIAVNSALLALVPLLLLLPVMVWSIVRIVRRQLAPVSRLAGHLDAQPADRPLPLPDEDIPDEIVPFVQAINRLFGRVGHLVSQQRRFIADAAHELRSPLTALSIQAQNLRQSGTLEVAQQRVLPLWDGIERARKLTEQLLNLARMQAETMEFVTVDVSAMARELVAEHLQMAESRAIDLGIDEAVPLTLVTVPETLRIILRNALENALKYAPQGGEVTLRLCSTAGNDIIEIIDNGPGIAASERDRVFDPFYRLPGAAGEGSGLGLAIAREAASSIGGAVSLHARAEGTGSVFRLQLKRHQRSPLPTARGIVGSFVG